MDSSNSGSFQSSSGGAAAAAAAAAGADNDEYDSRTQSISSFFNPSTNFNPNLNHLLHPQQPSYNHRPPPADNNSNTFYNPSSAPIQDPASPWTGTIRPDPNLPAFGTYNPSTMDTQTKTVRGSDHHHHHQIGVSVKNPKKRTRASRRAPTTVLTTDTTNFRQMVQEFTGIPTAPFTTAPFSRRLDLFGPTGSLHPLRPSAQKIQPFLNSTENIVESGPSNNNNTTTTTTTTATSSGNYQFSPSNNNNFQKQPSTFLDLQNPMFSFQSLLQNSNDLPKRWGDQNGKLESFEGQNIGGSKLNSGIENALSGGDQVQVQGNEGSWICPSN